MKDELIKMLVNDLNQIQRDLNIGAGMYTEEAYDDLGKRLNALIGKINEDETKGHGKRMSMPEIPQAIHDVLAERKRLEEVDGWTAERHDAFTDTRLAIEAANMAANYDMTSPDGRLDLVRAAALILAEIERLDRIATKEENNEEGKFCYHIDGGVVMSEKFDTIKAEKAAQKVDSNVYDADKKIYVAKHPIDLVSAKTAGEIAFENIVDHLDCDVIGGDDSCLEMSTKDICRLGDLINDFIKNRADVVLYGLSEVVE